MLSKKKNCFLFIVIVTLQLPQNIISSELVNVMVNVRPFPIGGNNLTSNTNHTECLNYNIAGIGNVAKREINCEYINFIENTFLANIYFIYPAKFTNIGVRLGYFDSGEIEQRNEYPKDVTGTYRVNSYLVAAALAKNVNRRFLYGVGMKLLSIGTRGVNYNKNIVVFDCGIMYIFPIIGDNNLCISAAGNNLFSYGRASLACAYNIKSLGLTVHSYLDYFFLYKTACLGLGVEITLVRDMIVSRFKTDAFNFSSLTTFSYDIFFNLSSLLHIKKDIMLSFGHTWTTNFNSFTSEGNIGVKF